MLRGNIVNIFITYDNLVVIYITTPAEPGFYADTMTIFPLFSVFGIYTSVWSDSKFDLSRKYCSCMACSFLLKTFCIIIY